jgi:hypothetical protein
MVRALVRSAASGITEQLAPATRPGRGSDIRSVSPSLISDRAVIEYMLTEAGSVRLSILDVCGRTVEVLGHERKQPGMHRLSWRPDPRLAPGVYFVSMRLAGRGGRPAIRKVIVTE